MSRFVVDSVALRSLAERLEGEVSRIDTYRGWRVGVAAQAESEIGDRASRAVERFLSEWQHGLDRLAGDGRAVVEALRAAAEVYETTESNIARPSIGPVS